MNICIYLLAKAYYVWQNKKREEKWNALTEEVRVAPTWTPGSRCQFPCRNNSHILTQR